MTTPYFNSYQRYAVTGNFHQDEEQAKQVDERTAVLKDDTKLRLTPPNQLMVDKLVFIGDNVKTNYSTGGKVIAVQLYYTYRLPNHSIIYADPNAKPNQDGTYRTNNRCYLNELVAQDGRILKLFYDNKDEVFVMKGPQQRMDFF